jgi:hypothetical protein
VEGLLWDSRAHRLLAVAEVSLESQGKGAARKSSRKEKADDGQWEAGRRSRRRRKRWVEEVATLEVMADARRGDRRRERSWSKLACDGRT